MYSPNDPDGASTDMLISDDPDDDPDTECVSSEKARQCLLDLIAFVGSQPELCSHVKTLKQVLLSIDQYYTKLQPKLCCDDHAGYTKEIRRDGTLLLDSEEHHDDKSERLNEGNNTSVNHHQDLRWNCKIHVNDSLILECDTVVENPSPLEDDLSQICSETSGNGPACTTTNTLLSHKFFTKSYMNESNDDGMETEVTQIEQKENIPSNFKDYVDNLEIFTKDIAVSGVLVTLKNYNCVDEQMSSLPLMPHGDPIHERSSKEDNADHTHTLHHDHNCLPTPSAKHKNDNHQRIVDTQDCNIVCDFCTEQFSDRNAHDRHVDEHILAKPCSKQYHIIHHVLTTRFRSVPKKKFTVHRCPKCEKDYSISQKWHSVHDIPMIYKIMFMKRENMVGNVKCSDCELSFMSNKQLQIHRRIHIGAKVYICRVCGESHAGKQSFDEHISRHMCQRNLPCSKCKKTFYDRGSLRKHEKICNVILTAGGFRCELCNKLFHRRATLFSHRAIHRRQGNYRCIPCGEYFITNKALVRHEKAHDKTVSCKVCGKAVSRLNMKTHLKDIHGPRPFKCQQCDLGFMTKYALSHHEKRMHIYRTPVPCEVCGVSLRSQQGLKIHMKAHTGDMEYCCTNCGKKFATKSRLKIHMFLHGREGKLKCPFCDRCYICKRALDSHVNTKHTGHKPYSCDKCDKKFVVKKSLKRHIFTQHSMGVKDFMCEKCGKAYPFKDKLSSHLRNFHKIVHP